MKIRKILLCAVMAVCCLCCMGFNEKQQKVYDDAGILTSKERRELEALAVEYAKETKCDLIIVTTGDNQGKSAMEYAEDFYMAHDFGYDVSHGDGVVFLIDMDGREIWISTSGKAISVLTDSRIGYILDICAPMLSDGEYEAACRRFLSLSRRYLKNPSAADEKDYVSSDEVYYVPDEKTGRMGIWDFLIKRVSICALFSAVCVWLLRRRSKAKMTVDGHTYARNHQCDVLYRQDLYLRTTVTKTAVPKSSSGSGGSSSHRGSGGHSFGGGGRRF